MREIIKDKVVINDDWIELRLQEGDAPDSVAIPDGKVIVPLKVWQAQGVALSSRAEIGVWIASDERPEELKGEIEKFAVIAVDFPKFSDGRGYSIAYNRLQRRVTCDWRRAARSNVLYAASWLQCICNTPRSRYP